MRQRTKIGTRFGVRHQHAVGETFVEHTTFEAEVDDLTTEQEAERRARVQLARCRKQKRGCKFVRAVSYRLAPLVVIGSWRDDNKTSASAGGPTVSARVWRASTGWFAYVQTLGVEGSTFQRVRETKALAKQAAEELMRDLGYLVGKGGAS